MADEKEKNGLGDIDDWLADLDDDQDQEPAAAAGADAGELDQSDIDNLLGGGDESPPAAAADADGESPELDQSDIDALFSDGGQAGAEAAPAAAGSEQADDDDYDGLDQSDLDALLAAADGEDKGGESKDEGQEQKPAAAPAAAEAKDDFDDLFGDLDDDGGEQSAEAGAAASAAGGDDLDELFGDLDGGGDAQPAPAPAPEAAAAPPADDGFNFDDDEFDVEGFDFDDSIPDIPDENEIGAATGGKPPATAPAASAADEDIFADSVAADAVGAHDGGAEGRQGRPWLAAVPGLSSLSGLVGSLPASVNRSTVGAGLLSLLVLIGGAYYFLGGKEPSEPAIPPQFLEQMVEAVEPERPELTAPPVARDDRYRMDEPGRAVSLQLAGRAADGGPVEFEIVEPPRYGRLSGTPPRITYLPNRDFPGEDSFLYRVSDGLLASEPARIRIVGPDHVRIAEADEPPSMVPEVEEVEMLAPERPLVRARDLNLRTTSTEPLLIDWAEIWRRENRTPFSPLVRVEILERQVTGRLTAVGPSAHRYEPDPYFTGQSSLSYRFHYGGSVSKPRRLTVQVALGDPAPKVRLRPLAEAYPVGDTVIVDARDTLAARPADLHFQWEQLSGTAVLLESLADNDAVVRFVAPSTFSTVTPRVVLQVTAIDPAGRSDSRVVEIFTPSRHQGTIRSRAEAPAEQRRSPLRGF